ncbi:hypothetical protein ABT033_37990 [Streptomyces pharetrae]|uniref:hypothetical protein n=1 Tax=Streptomyces pharetrae TaxID=291370 RepID=UPI00334B2D4E
MGGTTTHPEFDRSAVAAWLLAHDKITVLAGVPSATLVLRPDAGKEQRFRLDDPWLELATDAQDDDRLSGWMSDQDADVLAGLAAGEHGVAVSWLTAPGTLPLTVLGGARVTDRARRGGGGLRVTVSWPGALRGHTAPGPAGGGPPRRTCHRPGSQVPLRAPDLRRHRPHHVVPRTRTRGGAGDAVAPRRRHPLHRAQPPGPGPAGACRRSSHGTRRAGAALA